MPRKRSHNICSIRRRNGLTIQRLNDLLDIIHEDDGLLVVNKPAGLVCHPTKNGEMSSLIGRARLHLISTRTFNFNRRQPHLVNRLDRETSGVVIIAKNSEAAGELGKILEARAVEKEYLAIVHGHVAAEQGTIDAPLGKDERSIVAVKDCVRPDGAPSQTEFFVERRFSGHQLSTLNLQLFPCCESSRAPAASTRSASTSRTSAIPSSATNFTAATRIVYLALVQNRLTPAQRAKLIFENHALHARSIKFLWREKPIEFSCEPEPWFTGFLYQQN